MFVAIPLAPEVRTALHAAAAELRAAAPAITWTAAERLHLTVKFLGDVPEAQVAECEAAVLAAARNHRDVPLVVRGAGVFPTPARPRVVWAAVESDPRLELLHHDVEEAFARLGMPVEGRPFRPHVTLARVKRPLDAGERRALAMALGAFAFEDEGTASSLDLMQSTLTQNGPSYRRLSSASLRAG